MSQHKQFSFLFHSILWTGLNVCMGSFSGLKAQNLNDTAINLALQAKVSTINIASNSKRLAENVKDGIINNNPNSCWVPLPERISNSNPAVLVFSWKKKVSVNAIKLVGLPRNGQAWQLSDYKIGTWNGYLPKTEETLPDIFTSRDVFTKGEAGYYTFRIPSLTTTKKGTTLAICEGRKNNLADRGDIDLVIKRSSDNGLSWSPLNIIYGKDFKGTAGNPVVIADRENGLVHLIFCIDEKKLFYTSSKDDGLHFDIPTDITEQIDTLCGRYGFSWTGVWSGPGHGLQTKSGRLLVGVKPAGPKQQGVSRRVGVIYSDDHGRTWKAGGLVPSDLGEISESTLFENARGEIVMNIRWHEGNYRVISKSTDAGLTWSKPFYTKQLPDPGCEGSIIRYSTKQDDARVYFTNLSHTHPGTANRKGLALSMSNDDGEQWKQVLKITDGPSGYSDMTVDREGKLLILFERGTEIYSEKISMIRVDPDSIAGLQAALKINKSRLLSPHERFLDSSKWKELLSVNNESAETSVLHKFSQPVQTDNLILYISAARQQKGSVYLQEVEIYGTNK